MPLPKMPTKPAALLSTKDYPTADKSKLSKTVKTVSAEKAKPVVAASTTPKKKTSAAPAASKVVVTEPSAPVAKVSTATAIAAAAKSKIQDSRVKSGTSRAADKSGVTKLFVLDTNVLMHDPSSLFRFEEHDIYLPMITLEELDDHKKGM